MKSPERNKKKEKLLDHGIELISEFGYHGTGLKKILDRVKVPKGSFYNYFESKEHYVSEIIQKYSEDLLSRIDNYLEATDDDPLTQIKSIYYTAIDEIGVKGSSGCLLGNLAAEIGSSSSLCQKSMNKAFYEWKNRFVKLIDYAQKEGLVRDDLTAELLSNIFWDTWEGSLLRMKIDVDIDLRKNMDVMLDVLFKG